MIRHTFLIAALALAAVPSHAQKPAAAPAAAPALSAEAERAALDAAFARGRLLYGLDRAAWVGTDDMRARIRNFANQGVRGYIVERHGEGFAVTFYGGPADTPVAFYRGLVGNHRVQSREVFPRDARPVLTAEQRRLVAARDAAVGAVRGRPCGGQPFNSAVVPPAASGDPIDVYLLTPQVRNGEYPFGGHYRLTVAADGTVSGERAFTNSCLVMNPTAGAPRGSQPAAMMISHLLDPVPTEIHVFNSLAAGLPLYVAIGDPPRVYQVAGNRIERVEADGR